MLKEYELLIDLIKHYHTRRHDFNKTSLIINAILIGACTTILQVRSPTTPIFPLILFLCFLGISISVIWFFVSQRITIDTEQTFYQLRYIERRLGRNPGIFTFDRKFFWEKTTKNKTLNLPDSKDSLKFPRWHQRFRVVWTGLFFPLLFIGAYVVLLLIVTYYN